MSTTGPSSPPDPERLRFSIAGRITIWDPIYRHLEIGARTFSVAPGVSVARLAAGVQVTVTGEHPSAPDSRWIVTELTLE